MRLESANIKGFRSVRDAQLLDCGSFNVLIGKNNAGKSNVMSSISNFFTCVRGGDIVQLNPPAGNELDFFNRDTTTPITTKLVFSMATEEWDGLKADLTSEAPQMKHAVEMIGPTLRLAVTVSITKKPSPFAYVSLLELQSGGAGQTVLFAVDDKAARELYRRSERITSDVDEIKGLRSLRARLDTDDWQRFLSTPGSGERLPLKILFRRYTHLRSEVSDETVDKIDALLSARPTFEDFTAAVKGISTQLQNDADTVEASPLAEKVRTFSGDADSIPKYALNLINRIGSLKVLHLRELRRQIGKEEAARLLSLKVKRGGRNVLSRIEEMIQNLLGVQVDAFESEARTPRGGEVIAELDVDNFLVEVNGSGIRESLRLILDIEFESPQILLVEEPEVHLHPALETSMMQYLRTLALERQVFISTHSTNFLDTAQMRNVYLVSKETSTRIDLLDREEAEERLPRELGIRLSSMFLFDRLLLVEGPSDEDIIRAWAATMNINFSTANVGFVPIGGVRNMHYFASASTMSFLGKRQVKIIILIDRDERELDEVKKLADGLGARATLTVLNRREIENYLVCPNALRKFIAFKQKLAATMTTGLKEPTVAALKEDIASCLEELKPLAVSHRVIKELCHPVFIRPRADNREGIREAITGECDKAIAQIEEVKAQAENSEIEATRYVEENWKTSAGSLVPGSVLLDCVCQRDGVRFKKDLDGSRLASLMEENEIDDEIKEVIAEVSR